MGHPDVCCGLAVVPLCRCFQRFWWGCSCQVEQVQLVMRHGQRFGDPAGVQWRLDEYFAKHPPSNQFTGPLAFLNTYRQQQVFNDELTGVGASTSFAMGVDAWNKYGRILYEATPGQLHYKPRDHIAKPLLHTTSDERMWNTEINFALGFFGTSFESPPNPSLSGATAHFDSLVVPEGSDSNNTLSAYDDCPNNNVDTIGYRGEAVLPGYIELYTQAAIARLSKFAPPYFELTPEFIYGLQTTCAVEYSYLGDSNFCGLFTLEEWKSYGHTIDIGYYYDGAWGGVVGRAIGIGLHQEIMARLEKHLITSSHSSINSTIDSNAKTFPLDERMYFDFTHDFVIVPLLTALSLDYFRIAPSLVPPPTASDEVFRLNKITPLNARFAVELIGCADASPTPFPTERVTYYPGEYGYDPENAPHKFVRLRLNNAVIPLSSLAPSAATPCERSDGLCPLADFLASQADAVRLANFDYVCFGNYTVPFPPPYDYDGTIFRK